MKKLGMLLVALVLMFTLAGCNNDDGTFDGGRKTTDSGDNTDVDPVDEVDDMFESLDSTMETLLYDTVNNDLMYFKYPVAVTDHVQEVYYGRNTEGITEIYVIRLIVDGFWGPIEYIISFDVIGNELIGIEIIDHQEQRGAFIVLETYRDQFAYVSINYFLSNSVSIGIDGDASATTTIPAMEESIKEAINFYYNNLT